MASQAMTFGPGGGEFQSDGTQQLVTLLIPGGSITNLDAVNTIWVNIEGSSVLTADGNNASNFPIAPKGTLPLPVTCFSFTHKSPAGAFGIYKGRV